MPVVGEMPWLDIYVHMQVNQTVFFFCSITESNTSKVFQEEIFLVHVHGIGPLNLMDVVVP